MGKRYCTVEWKIKSLGQVWHLDMILVEEDLNQMVKKWKIMSLGDALSKLV